MNDFNDNDVISSSALLTSGGVVDMNNLINVDWDAPLYDFSVTDEYRWITAIQKVSPKSGQFWYDYGKRNNETVVMKIVTERNVHGRRCCDVLVYTRRPIGDVVLSAWQEYTKHFEEKGNG